MNHSDTPAFVAAAILVAGTLLTNPAHAHIDTVGALMSRGGDQKAFPCDGRRGAGPVYTFQPGSTITLSISENIPHPSYFRIAFDNDGDDGFIEPKSIDPIDPLRACPFDSKDQCGEADYCNVVSATGATVLWDNIEPHMAGGLKTYTWNVKLPDVECENCVIQILQIMQDTIHGAYCPTGSCTDSSLEDIYHRCIDIKLQKGATNSPGTTTQPVEISGMQCMPTGGTTPPATAGTSGSPLAGAGGGASGASGSAAGAGAAGIGGGVGAAGAVGTAGTSAGSSAASAGTPAIAGSGSMVTAGAAAAGSGARAGSPAGIAAGSSAGAAGIGTTTSATGVAGASVPAASAPIVPTTQASDGCSTIAGSHTSGMSALWLVLGTALVFSRRRRSPLP